MNRISDAEFFVCVSPHSDVYGRKNSRVSMEPPKFWEVSE